MIILFLQIFHEFLHGSGSVADAVLDFLTQLSKTLVIAFRNEDWVVAEAFGTMFLGGDMAVYDTLELVDFLDAGAAARTYILLLDVADNSAEAGLAVFLTVQFSQQLSHVSLTVVVGSLGIAGTVNARGTIKCLYLQTGIIGKATYVVMVINILRLLQGILFQCVTCFRNIHIASYLLQRYYLVAAAQDVANLLEFMLVICCKTILFISL